jgi:hypothetical protein
MGVFFNSGDYPPNVEDVFAVKKTQNVCKLPKSQLDEKMQACLKKFGVEHGSPKAMRFAGCLVDSGLLEWLGDSDFGFTHSSSTVPTMISDTLDVDHRLYKPIPYRVGKIVEVPISVYGSRRSGWLSPVPNFGVTDNFMEIARKVELLVVNLSIRDLVAGCSPFLEVPEDAIAVRERLDLWLKIAMGKGFRLTDILDVESESEGV